MPLEALILRRCYPVPVIFSDLRSVANDIGLRPWPSTRRAERITGNAYGPQARAGRVRWTAALKEAASALDEVYAVVDGREVRVALASPRMVGLCGTWDAIGPIADRIDELMDAADRAGYWERPHEVRLDLQERPVSHDEVARAVMVGQEYAERKAVWS